MTIECPKECPMNYLCNDRLNGGSLEAALKSDADEETYQRTHLMANCLKVNQTDCAMFAVFMLRITKLPRDEEDKDK